MCVEQTVNFLKGKLQKDTCFFASRGGFIVVFNITCRTGMQYVKFMLHTTETQKRLYFWGNSGIFLRKTPWYVADSGKVHEKTPISMVLRCKMVQVYFNISVPEWCVWNILKNDPLPSDSDVSTTLNQ